MKFLYPRRPELGNVPGTDWGVRRVGPQLRGGKLCVFKSNTGCMPALRTNELCFDIRISCRFPKTEFQVHMSNTLVRRRESRSKYKGMSYLFFSDFITILLIIIRRRRKNVNSSEAYIFKRYSQWKR
jgi:hypothetical protein